MIERKTVSQCVSSDYCKGWNDAVDAMPKWINANKELPKESGTYLVGVVNRKRDVFYHISNTFYSAVHMRFNTLDYIDGEEAKKTGFDNRYCYWMPLPEAPKEDA